MTADAPEPSGPLERILSLAPAERSACGWSFLCFFSILCAYFLLRPVRDEMAILAGPEHIPKLFIGTFAAVILLVPVFGWITKRFARRSFLPLIFGFCSLNLVLFWWVFGAEGIDQIWTARVFFVWLSVFNMFVVALFWSFMADVYSKDQARRLFGLIASGGSAGAILGPAATALLVNQIGIRQLFLISAALLVVTVFTIYRLLRWGRDHAHGDHPINERRPIGGGVLEGVLLVLRTPYLALIAVIILIGTFSGTALYMYQAQLFSAHITDSQDRTQLLAAMDTSINILAFILQAFVARHAIRKLGVAVTLSLMPALSVLGFVAVALAPGVALLVVLQVIRRATNFGLNGPARETLFTVVSAHSKYKAKNFMDVTLVRGADVISSQSIQFMQGALASFTPVAFFCAGLCVAWGLVALLTGRRYQRLYETERTADAAAVAKPV